MVDQFALNPFAWCQASPGTSFQYPEVVLWCKLTMAIFRPILGHFGGKYCFFGQILIYEIDFYVQEESKNTIGKNSVTGGYQWPNFHHFWNCGHIMPKHKTKIDTDHTSVMMNMCVKLEKNLRWYFLEIFKMGKIAGMSIKWPKLENVYFLLKK